MSSKKKGKKQKAQTVALTEFLASNGGVPTIPIKSTSWADDVEDEYDGVYHPRASKEPIVLPTAPRAARGPAGDDDSIPMSPPFVAYVSNLPYDVVEEDLAEFFAELQVSNVRLPKDSTKLRGYGYVEFEDRASLIEALNLSNTMIKTRRVRIEVSNSSNDDRRGGRMGMGRDNRRDYGDDPERTSGDWRSRPREELPEREDRFRSRGFDRSEGSSEADNKPGGWREGDRPAAFSDRRPERRGFGGDERRGGFRDDDRRGFRDDDRRGFRDDDRRGFRDDDRRGFRDDDRRGFRDDDRKESQDWREGQRDNTSSFAPRRVGADREPAREDREAAPSNEPRTRPTLNLLPRTKPIEPIVVKEVPVEEKEEPKEVKEENKAPKPNVFGAAKPVDTAAREREIEERLAKTQAEKPKKEAEEEAPAKPAAWTRRNGEGAKGGEREKDKPKPSWRSEEDRSRQSDRRQPARGQGRNDQRGDSRGPPNSRSGAGSRGGTGKYEARGPPEKERREKERRDSREDPPMPKASDEQAPNFVASNKYSMLNEDGDTDVILD